MQSVSEAQWKSLNSVANAKRTAEVRRFYRDLGLDPVVIKGWAVARFYDVVPRTYTDIDLFFDPSLAAAVIDAWADFGSRGVAVDFHFGLRGLDTLPWSEVFARSYLVDLDGVPIRVLADEDNLRVTSVHWLTDGGVNKERLWDIYYLVKNRKADFDWDRCLESNGPVRKTWVMAAIATARDHLELDLTGLPVEAQNFLLPDWYKKTLKKEWQRGPYPRRKLSNVIMRPKLLIEQLNRRFPPNRIAATIDTETPIDDSSRVPAQIKSLMNKVGPFARGVTRRITYSLRREHTK